MKRLSLFFRGCAPLMTYLAFVLWVFCVSVVQNHCTELSLRLPWLFLYIPAVYALNLRLAEKGIGLSLYTFLQLLWAIGGFVLFWFCAELSPGGLGTRIFVGLLYAAGMVASAYLATEETPADTLTVCFDIGLVLAILLLLLNRFTPLPDLRDGLIGCAVAESVTLIALSSRRSNRTSAAGSYAESSDSAGHSNIPGDSGFSGYSGYSGFFGKLFLAGLILLISALAVLTGLLFTGRLGSIAAASGDFLRNILDIFKNFGLFLLNVIYRCALFLTSFAKTPLEEEAVMEAPPVSAETEISLSAGQADWPSYLPILVSVLALCLLAILIFRLRRERLKRRERLSRVYAYSFAEKRSGGLREAILRFLKNLFQKIRWQFRYLRHRKSAVGMLAWCEKKASRRNTRRAGESGSAFLLRLADASGTENNAEQSNALRRLAAKVEQVFYSGVPDTADPELFHQIRQCRFDGKSF